MAHNPAGNYGDGNNDCTGSVRPLTITGHTYKDTSRTLTCSTAYYQSGKGNMASCYVAVQYDLDVTVSKGDFEVDLDCLAIRVPDPVAEEFE